MPDHKVSIQSLIDHIKTAGDVDPWAKEMVEELLKEREPRVLTPDEIIGWDGYIYAEYRQGVMDVSLIVKGIENNRHTGIWATKKLNWEEYGKMWRYWSAMPTNEQRKAVKWNA